MFKLGIRMILRYPRSDMVLGLKGQSQLVRVTVSVQQNGMSSNSMSALFLVQLCNLF